MSVKAKPAAQVPCEGGDGNFNQDCSEKRTKWKGSDISQTPELRLSDSSTGRAKQCEQGAVVQHQATAVLQGMCVHLETCKALFTKDCAVLRLQNSRETIDKDHFRQTGDAVRFIVVTFLLHQSYLRASVFTLR